MKENLRIVRWLKEFSTTYSTVPREDCTFPAFAAGAQRR
jgi:hypothetical protein